MQCNNATKTALIPSITEYKVKLQMEWKKYITFALNKILSMYSKDYFYYLYGLKVNSEIITMN